MKARFVIACLTVLAAACSATEAPTPSPAATPSVVLPSPSPSVRSWSIYTSEIKTFSLQIPSDWEVSPGIPAENILLRINGGADGRLLMLEENPEATESFESFARRYFDAALEDDPDALEIVTYEAGRAARVRIPSGQSMTVQYLFPADGGASQILSFTWDEPTVNPIWEMVAERFNPSSTEPIIPFGTPAPS